ncbi:MAG TPA: DUF721 domain-containing protein [Acidimicrobiales bacterium]|nr:DUF721 domain-containing protein [Acidimicrobiales bacterium]
MSDVGPRRMGDHLDRVLRGLGAPDVDTIEVVFDRWETVVGSTLAERSRPAAIDGAELVIVVDEPAMASHLGYLESNLVERLGELLGPGRVTSIRVRVERR